MEPVHTFLFLPGSSQIPGVVLQIVHSVQHSNNLFWSQKTLLTLTQFCSHSDYACICWIAALHLLLSLSVRLRDYPDTGIRMILRAPIHSQPILGNEPNRTTKSPNSTSQPFDSIFTNQSEPSLNRSGQPVGTTTSTGNHRSRRFECGHFRGAPFTNTNTLRFITHNVLTLYTSTLGRRHLDHGEGHHGV